MLAVSCAGSEPTAEVATPSTSGGQSCAQDPLSLAQWSAAFRSDAAGSLSGVWGTGPNDVFIVGGGDLGAEIYHYDGADWQLTTIPSLPLLVWVYGFSPMDVYAVGVSGAMIHFDGVSWSVIETGTTDDLWGVFGFAPDDLWIVGGDPFEGGPTLLHYDGLSVLPTLLPAADNPPGAHALFKVWGIDGVLHAVGQKGLIVAYDAGSWRAVDAGPLADQDFVSLWGTASDNIVAVGGRSSARIAGFDGSTWTTAAPADLGGLNAVFMADPESAFIGGVTGFAGRYQPATGAVVHDAVNLSHLDIHAMWGDGAGAHYAVAGTFAAPHQGAAFVRRCEP